jgi:hypothetical protein
MSKLIIMVTPLTAIRNFDILGDSRIHYSYEKVAHERSSRRQRFNFTRNQRWGPAYRCRHGRTVAAAIRKGVSNVAAATEFDGTQSYDSIAKKVGVTAEAVRQLSIALKEKGFVALDKGGARSCPRKLL